MLLPLLRPLAASGDIMRGMWKKIGAGILLFWHPIEWVLSKLEHAEFVIEHLPWLARMMEWTRQVFEVPVWVASWAVPITGLMLLCWLFWPQLKQRHRRAQVEVPPQPIEIKPDESPYMEGYEVISYMADESAWGKMIEKAISPNGMRYKPRIQAFVEFRERAQNGDIGVLGRLGGSGQHQEIPATYWLSGGLDFNTTQRQQSSDTAPAIPQGDRIPIYRNVVINRADVYKAWPRRLGGTEPDAGEWMPLGEAANLAYGEARKVGSAWAHLAECGLSGILSGAKRATPKEITNWFVEDIAHAGVSIRGNRLPSQSIDELNDDDRKRLVNFANLQVRRSDLNDYIKRRIHNGLKANTKI
jgi:hypothetical protein